MNKTILGLDLGTKNLIKKDGQDFSYPSSNLKINSQLILHILLNNNIL
ncbi:MAG: hypothetical protein IPK18_01235 [Sphingobacteriales bacterium]|nr:MAG: hypothetical protein IPK18_01235 [Sphingobacteriales bacterium]